MMAIELPLEVREVIGKYRKWKKHTVPPKKVLEKLYWEYGLSTRSIARLFRVSQSTLRYWFRRYDIHTRDYIKAVIKAKTKYVKRSFDGSLELMAYLLGITYGDIHVRKASRQIIASTGTTHPALLQLFHNLFSPYGVIRLYPRYCKKTSQFSWNIYCLLDSSFEFLLIGHDIIPLQILENDRYFCYFLAGLFDAEGSIVIARSRRFVLRRFSIANHNFRLITALMKKLGT